MEIVPPNDAAVKLNIARLKADAQNLSKNRKSDSNNLKSEIETTIKQTTNKARESGTIPEKFPDTQASVLVEPRQTYLASALEETRSRISRYYAASNRLG